MRLSHEFHIVLVIKVLFKLLSHSFRSGVVQLVVHSIDQDKLMPVFTFYEDRWRTQASFEMVGVLQPVTQLIIPALVGSCVSIQSFDQAEALSKPFFVFRDDLISFLG